MQPPAKPYGHGMLEVGDRNRVYWQVSGNPGGVPVLWVHGGPGSGSGAGSKGFDPDRYRVVLFDQRQCGRSRPHASHPGTDLRHNTTDHLIADMEQLREHLGIERWLLSGGSWGTTLALAYAQRHPTRVRGMLLISVTTTRRSEIDWLYRGVGRFFPQQWEEFRDGVPAADRDGDLPDLLAAYGRLLADPDPRVRACAAARWCAWEDALISHEHQGRPGAYSDRPEPARIALARICAHYFSHGAWLEEGALLRDASRLAGIPGELVHGRLDLSGPVETAWQLARAWPGAELTVVDDAGHTGSPSMGQALTDARARLGDGR